MDYIKEDKASNDTPTGGTKHRSRTSYPKPSSMAPEDLKFAHLGIPAGAVQVVKEARRATTRRCCSDIEQIHILV